MKQLVIITATFTLLTMSLINCVKDPCKDVKCKNGGTCSKGSCACPSGYEGTLCENKVNAKFTGGYSGKDCNGDNAVIVISAGSSPADITLNDGTVYPSIHGTVSGNSMTFPTQIVTDNLSGDGLTVSGTGSLNGNSITVTFSMKDNVTLENAVCTVNASK